MNKKKQNNKFFLSIIIISFLGILLATIYHIFIYKEKNLLIDKKIISKRTEVIRPQSIKCLNDTCKNVGDIISFGSEQFYVINNDGKNIQMLSKYNLDIAGVENMIDGDNLQDSKVKGTSDWKSSKDVYGGIEFAYNNYWVDSKESYIYNDKSKIYNYVENYVKYLNKHFLVHATGNLLSVEQAEKLGCSKKEQNCLNAPKWVSSTSYWLGDYYDKESVWFISNAYSGFAGNVYSDKIDLGIRPVITIDVQDLFSDKDYLNEAALSVVSDLNKVINNTKNIYINDFFNELNSYYEIIYSVYD